MSRRRTVGKASKSYLDSPVAKTMKSMRVATKKRQTGTGEPAARERTNSGHENDPKSNVAIDQMSAKTEATEMSDMSVTTLQGSKVENILA